MKLFLLSGLGADSRVFNFLDLPRIDKVPVEWIPPKDHESLADYTARLSIKLKDHQPVSLLGVSFGGLIAQELTKHLQVKHLIIVSSIKSSSEMGLAFRITKKLGIFKLFPPGKMKKGMLKMGPKLFGLKDEAQLKLFREITNDTDNEFLEWAVNQIHTMQIPTYRGKMVHIHGTDDKMFPPGKIVDYIPIQGGGHFMIVNKANEISEIIMDQLRDSLE